ncbi:hypothetical protein_gp232 [Bacillus phage vB_BceM_WH1]|nr:hypothetical protein_gp232 [Bacillus phage vB_BceM_WH1]
MNHIGETNYARIVGKGGNVRYCKYVILAKPREIRSGFPPEIARWAESKGVELTPHWTASHREEGWMASLYIHVDRIRKDEYLKAERMQNNEAVFKFKSETEVW